MSRVHWVRPSLLSPTADDEALALLRFPGSGRTDIGFIAPGEYEEGELLVTRASACVPQLPPAASAASTLRRNRVGDAFLLTSPSGVWIIQPPLSRAVRTSLGSVPTAVTALGGLAPGAVIDAQFHPLSDAHVFVLSRDGLRAYDIRGGGTAAPSVAWLFPPGSLGGSAPTAFAFGAARGWELFAVFVLAESGALSYLTPVLPPGVLLPAADWNELRADLAAADAAPAPVNDAFAEAARITLHWLDTSFEDVPGAPAWRRHMPSEADPVHGRYSGGRVVPALQGPVSFAPALVIPAEAPGLPPPPAVDLAVLPPAAVDFTTVVLAFGDGRIVSVCSSEPVLPAWGRPLRRGAAADSALTVVPLAAADEPLHSGLAGSRGGSSGGSSSGGGGGVPWLVADAVHLDLGHPLADADARVAAGGAAFAGGLAGEGLARGSSGVDAAAAAALGDLVHVPRLMQVPSMPDVVVVVSRHAVHALSTGGWVHAVRRLLSGDPSALQQQQQRGGGGGGGGLSQAFRLLQGERIDVAGACLAPRGDDLLVWSLQVDEAACGADSGGARVRAPGTLHRLSVSGRSSAAAESGLASAVGESIDTAPAGDEEGADVSFAQLSADFPAIFARARDVAAQISRRRVEAASSESGAPSAALAEASDSLKAAIEPLLRVRVVTHARARQIAASATLCTTRARSLAEEVEGLQTAALGSHARLATLSAHADNLKARAEAVLFALTLQSGLLSRAEQEYGAEMEAMDGVLKTQVEAGFARVQATLAGLAPPAAAQQTSLAASRQVLSGGLDSAAVGALSSGLGVSAGTIQRSMRKIAELRATLDGLAGSEQN